jgi:hypothetical protein
MKKKVLLHKVKMFIFAQAGRSRPGGRQGLIPTKIARRRPEPVHNKKNAQVSPAARPLASGTNVPISVYPDIVPGYQPGYYDAGRPRPAAAAADAAGTVCRRHGPA